ncbi:MAG: trehalase family glycosidase, partial [Fidelibacterota bacterium]
YGGADRYAFPAVCEGPCYFRVPITYSAQCHMLETRWMKDPSIARGSILNFVQNQLKSGSFPGHVYPNWVQKDGFYHANWGRAVLELNRVHPDEGFLNKVYHALSRYAEYFDRERDRENSGLYDVINQFETGQEYMSRYMAVGSNSDSGGWGEKFRLKGVDATVYMYELKQALQGIADKLGILEDSYGWKSGADRIKNALLEIMWDPEAEIFSDVDPSSGRRTGIKAAVSFYPYMTDIVDESHLTGLKRHLFNPEEFWTPYPVPSTSLDDSYFSEYGEWKGKRHNCPWNGRVWPMTNSHIAEVLAGCALRFNDDELKNRAVDFIERFIRMMFFNSDVRRPNSFEHYNPFTGKPSIYRGVDDYQHSWIVDLIIKYVAGVIPMDGVVVVEPFPFELEWLKLEDVIVAGKNFKIEREESKFRVWVDGELKGEKHIGAKMVFHI